MLFHNNRRRLQSLDRACTDLESNGKPKSRHVTTVEDLNWLYDQIEAGGDGSSPPWDPDPETEIYLNGLYNQVVESMGRDECERLKRSGAG